MTKIFSVLILVLLSGCALSSKKVPKLNADNIPTVELASLKPRTVSLKVVNTRVINKEAGNTEEVERAVREAMTKALWRTGVSVKDSSPNALEISVNDHQASADDGECVKLFAKMQMTGNSSIKADSFACHSKIGIGGLKLSGDLANSYERAMGTLLQKIDRKMDELFKSQ